MNKLAWEGEYKRKGKLWRGVAEVEDIEGFLQRNSKILEVGCGNGKTLVQLLERGYYAVGVDVSKEALKFGGKNLTSDARYLPFLNSSFDAVVCRFVLEHLRQKERIQALAEMRRVLKRHGLLFLTAFSIEDMRYFQSLKNEVVEKNTFKRKSGIICHYFTEFELRNLLRQFQVLIFKVNKEKKIFDGEQYVRANFSAVAAKGEELDS